MLGGGEDFSKDIWRVFTKTHGLTLQIEAVECLKCYLQELMERSREQVDVIYELGRLASAYKQQSVDRDALATVIEGMRNLSTNGNARLLARNFIHVLNANDCPRWDYDPHQKLFISKPSTGGVLGKAESKFGMYRRHYEILKQRTMRSPMFNGPNCKKIMSIKAIKGQKGGERKCLFGMLSVIEEQVLYLEDTEDYIKLDLGMLGGIIENESDTVLPALYTEGMMVVVAGLPNGDSFTVEFMSPPPLESRQQSLATLSHPKYNIGLSMTTATEQISNLEAQYQDSAIVVLSDVWLDCNRTVGGLQRMLAGFEHMRPVPAAFLVIGSFFSNNSLQGAVAVEALRKAFDMLAATILRYPNIAAQSKFIFIPALDDPLSSKILPRPALPEELLKSFYESGLDAVMASNPTRTFAFSKEIIVGRLDATLILRKNLLPQLIRSAHGEIGTIKTLLQQAHLCPLPISVQPRAWELDHSLTLYPNPDYLIISERSKSSCKEVAGTVGINPGSFSTCNFSFVMFYPLTGVVQPWYTLLDLLIFIVMYPYRAFTCNTISLNE